MRRIPFAVAVAAFAPAPVAQVLHSWQLREQAACTAVGGCFRDASIAADSRTMLTAGDLGDTILWDLREGRGVRRFAAPGERIVRVYVHPHEPWAVLKSARPCSRLFRIYLGSGRCEVLPWDQPVRAFAFSADGRRAAVLFDTAVAVYPDAALRSARPASPDFQRRVANENWYGENADWVAFHPRDDVVLLGDSHRSLRVPLDGREPTVGPPDLRGFLSDGSPVVSRVTASVAGAHWVYWRESGVQREGIRPRTWALPWSRQDPVVASDGTVVVADDFGAMRVLGESAAPRHTLRGHRGRIVHMCFDASNRWLALVCGGAVNVLDVTANTTRQIEGTFGVQPAPCSADFLLLDRSGVCRFDPARMQVTDRISSVPSGFEAAVLCNGARGSRKEPWLWQPKPASLWLGVTGSGKWGDPARIARGMLTGLAERPSADHEACSLSTIEMAAVAQGDIVCADTKEPGGCCGTGLQRVTHWSRLRRFDRQGQLLKTRTVAPHIDWMRASPRGTRIAVGQGNGGVQVFAGDLSRIGPVPRLASRIVAFEFLDERSALASDGARLFVVSLRSGRRQDVPLPPLPGPITSMCLSPDQSLVAVACTSEVRVLRRR